MAQEVTAEKVSSGGAKAAGEPNTGMAILAYFIFFIPLLTDAKEDEFVKFHVKQSIMLLIAGIALSIVSSVLTIILIGLIIGPIGALVLFVLWVMGIMNAAQGKKEPLPLIGKYAEEWFKF